MKQSTTFLETIKMVDGQFISSDAHLQRMIQTAPQLLSCNAVTMKLFSELTIPQALQQGTVKCRIIYTDQKIELLDFQPYTPRKISSLKLVYDNEIDYSKKYADRTALSNLFLQKMNADDILIVKQGYLTDTSYSNIVLSDGLHFYTPTTYLLNGTQRQRLLSQGLIEERKLTPADLSSFQKLYLINAMLSIEDNVSIDVCSIIL